MKNPIPCYVSGKGMYASTITWDFKTTVIQTLESTGLGFDTRYRYYQRQFPEKEPSDLARLICDPIEYYDKDWPAYLDKHGKDRGADEVVLEFFSKRDALFRQGAAVAIYCYDEAGFGSGVNSMRFIAEGKALLGFYNPQLGHGATNIHNVMQLEMEFPHCVSLVHYASVDEIPGVVSAWLQKWCAQKQKH